MSPASSRLKITAPKPGSRFGKVTEEKMADGELKLTIWFTNSKRGLVLNRTNNRVLRAALGRHRCRIGKIIVLYPTTQNAARWSRLYGSHSVAKG
jgi:hypothetical protein